METMPRRMKSQRTAASKESLVSWLLWRACMKKSTTRSILQVAIPSATTTLKKPGLTKAMSAELGGELVDPLKTTVVQGLLAMTTWVLRKSSKGIPALLYFRRMEAKSECACGGHKPQKECACGGAKQGGEVEAP